ncbi:CD209 antigen-like protein C isoform X2 [Mustelus asterias]
MDPSDECVHFSDFHHDHDQPRRGRGKHEKLKPVSQLFSETKKSNVDFGMKLSQLNNSVTGISEKASSAHTSLQTEVAQLKEFLGLIEKTRSLNELHAAISQLKESMPNLQCPVQWTPFKQNLYYFSSRKSTWKEARKFCQLMDADLAVINSTEEQMYIRWNSFHDHWIGLNDIDEERKWQWVDGTDYDSNLKFWRKGQPDLEATEDEDCVVNSGEGGWDDWPCSSIHFTICEKSA